MNYRRPTVERVAWYEQLPGYRVFSEHSEQAGKVAATGLIGMMLLAGPAKLVHNEIVNARHYDAQQLAFQELDKQQCLEHYVPTIEIID